MLNAQRSILSQENPLEPWQFHTDKYIVSFLRMRAVAFKVCVS